LFTGLVAEAGLRIDPNWNDPVGLWLAKLMHEMPNAPVRTTTHTREGLVRKWVTRYIPGPCLSSDALCSSLQRPARIAEQRKSRQKQEGIGHAPGPSPFPPLPSKFQEHFEAARTKCDLDDATDRHHPHPGVQALRFPVVIQKVFFAYCTQARNAFREGAWTLAQVGPAVDAAWLWIFDSYFSRERGAVSDMQKSTMRAAFWNTVADDQRWKQHLTELDAVVNRAPDLHTVSQPAEIAIVAPEGFPRVEPLRGGHAAAAREKRGPKTRL
jgi:hypothetical protein